MNSLLLSILLFSIVSMIHGAPVGNEEKSSRSTLPISKPKFPHAALSMLLTEGLWPSTNAHRLQRNPTQKQENTPESNSVLISIQEEAAEAAANLTSWSFGLNGLLSSAVQNGVGAVAGAFLS